MEKPIKIVKIWVELDEFVYSGTEEISEDYCNATVYLSNGSILGVNIWSEKLFYEQVSQLNWIDGQVADLPDLIVRNFDSESIRGTILNLEEQENWFQGRGYPIIPDREEYADD